MKYKLQSQKFSDETLNDLNNKVTKFCNENSLDVDAVAITGHWRGNCVGGYDYYVATVFYRSRS